MDPRLCRLPVRNGSAFPHAPPHFPDKPVLSPIVGAADSMAKPSGSGDPSYLPSYGH